MSTLSQNQPNACLVQKGKQPEIQEVTRVVYFGIFFDGTGANKFQMMLGKKYRLDRMFERLNDVPNHKEIKEEIKVLLGKKQEESITAIDILSIGRDYWEGKNVYTVSELDQMFFGYDSDYLIENRIVDNTDGWELESTAGDAFKNLTLHQKPMASSPNRKEEISIIKNTAEQITTGKKLNRNQEKSIKKAEGTAGQNETYTNIAILESCFQYKREGNEYYIPIYVEGSGSDMQLLPKNITIHTLGHMLEGFARSTGFTGVAAKVAKVIKMIQRKIRALTLSDIYSLDLSFDVFGFSRGATESRIFTHVVKLAKGQSQDEKLNKLTGTNDPFLKRKIKNDIQYKFNVRFLGIMDTVSSVGVIRNLDPLYEELIGNVLPKWMKRLDKSIDQDAKESFIKSLSVNHDQNVNDYGLADTTSAASVFHICALDEFRRNFALVDIESSIDSNGLEVFLPGCHTDIGGAATIGRDSAKLINSKIKVPDMMRMKDQIQSNPLWPIELEILKGLGFLIKPEISILTAVLNLAGKASPRLSAINEEIKEDLRKIVRLLKSAIKTSSAVLGGPLETNGTEVMWPACRHFDKTKAVYYPVTVSGLEQIGLLKSGDIIDYGKNQNGRLGKTILDSIVSIEGSDSYATCNPELGHFVIYHYSKPGYSNISLHLMYNRYKKVLKESVFPMCEIPIGYRIPAGLKDWYNGFNSEIEKLDTGRCFVSPDESTYQWLRNNYLHVSSNDQWLDPHANKVVDGPSHYEINTNVTSGDHVVGIIENTEKTDIKKRIAFTSRIVYQGKAEDNSKNNNWKFLFDYNPSEYNVIDVSRKIRKIEENISPSDTNCFESQNKIIYPAGANDSIEPSILYHGEAINSDHRNSSEWHVIEDNGEKIKILVAPDGTILNQQKFDEDIVSETTDN